MDLPTCPKCGSDRLSVKQEAIVLREITGRHPVTKRLQTSASHTVWDYGDDVFDYGTVSVVCNVCTHQFDLDEEVG